MRSIAASLCTVALIAGPASTAAGFELAAGAPLVADGLDQIVCSVVHTAPTKTASIEIALYNAGGGQVATKSCSRTFGVSCALLHDPTGTTHMCIAKVSGVSSKFARGSLCTHDDTTGNPVACLPLTKTP